MDCVPDADFETLLSRIRSPALLVVAQCWNEARGKKRMPSWADLSSCAQLADDMRLWGFTYDRQSREFTGRLAGRRAAKWVSGNVDDIHLKDLYAHGDYKQAQQLLTRIVATPMAIRTSGRLFMADSFMVTGERIALPMAEDGRTGDGVLGASDYTPPPLLGSLKLINENVEWFAI